MSTLEKAIGLLQEMSEDKLEAVYMYIRFVNSQSDNNENLPALNKSTDSLAKEACEYTVPTLKEKETFNRTQKNTIEKRQHGFQGLMSFAGTLPEDFDYKKELEEARKEKYGRFI